MRATTGVTVAELRRAWHAIEAGNFTEGTNPGAWWPDEPALPVLGAHGQSGASTLALALASAVAPARVVECVSPGASGLVSASTAELGATDDGSWLRGTRGDVLIDRHAAPATVPLDVARPGEPGRPVSLTVVDVGWPPAHFLGGSSWLGELVRRADCVVICAVGTVPGLRRLEATLALLPDQNIVAAVLGPLTRRWSKRVAASAGSLTRRLVVDDRVVAVPEVAAVRVAGITTDPVPRALLAAAEEVLRVAELPVSTPDLEDDR